MPVVTSSTEICNLALSLLGSETIVDVNDADDDSKERTLCAFHYGRIRDSVLRAHPWNFAVRRVALASDSGTPAFEYEFQFVLPADCLRIIRTSIEAEFGNDDYRIETDGTSRLLLSNDSSVKIEYIAQITNVALYDSLFVDVLVARLAAELSYALTDNSSLGADLRQLYTDKLTEARNTDAQEGTPRQWVETTWLDARS